jgi:serine/threonine-protein kinase
MALIPGSRIGPFEVVGWLGAGGMGEVYRARDTRLGRDVAIKIVGGSFVDDAERVRRFEQEACAAGQLNHPNLLVVHDIGLHERTPFIVSELLRGESLRVLLGRGPLAPPRALEYARQAAEGLAAAHANGIVHRDLKPDNLFVTHDDRLKILDFGLAKLTQATGRPLSAASQTEIGTVLGTVQYMSPEQLRGEAVDVRSDIFSLGCILHEMLTGRAPFARATQAETIAAILTADPEALPATVNPAIGRVIHRSIEKSRDARFQSARDLGFAFDELSRPDRGVALPMPQWSWPRARTIAWLIAAALAGALVVTELESRRRPAAAPAPLRLSVDLGADAPLANGAMQFGNAVAISKDGSTLAFVAQQAPDVPPQIYVRRLDEPRATVLPGTDGANAPFFSDDGKWIGFDGGLRLMKVAVSGGAPIGVTGISSFRGASWQTDGTIVLAPNQVVPGRLMQLTADGGPAVAVSAAGDSLHAWPQVLPGGRAVLYTTSRVGGAFNDGNLVVQPLPSGEPKVIQRGGYHAQYVLSGHVLYVHDGSLFALPFDAERLEATGPPVRVVSGVVSNPLTGGADFSVSDNGTLVYLEGAGGPGPTPLDVVDRRGRAVSARTTPANWQSPAYSPDGERVAMAIREGPVEAGDIWTYDIARGTLLRITADNEVDAKPIWTPDGRRLVFASTRDGDTTPNLFWMSANGDGTPQRLTTSRSEQLPGSWHPSGRFLAYEELHQNTMRDVMILPIDGSEESGWQPGRPWVFAQSPQMDWEPRFSPDGRWLAYASTESGRWEVYVRPFPGPGPAVQASTTGGELPTWSKTASELIYGIDGQLMIVPYAVKGGKFTVAPATPWVGGRYQTRGRNRMFDLHPDGQHAVLALAPRSSGAGTTTVQFVVNFFTELNRLAPH